MSADRKAPKKCDDEDKEKCATNMMVPAALVLVSLLLLLAAEKTLAQFDDFQRGPSFGRLGLNSISGKNLKPGGFGFRGHSDGFHDASADFTMHNL